MRLDGVFDLPVARHNYPGRKQGCEPVPTKESLGKVGLHKRPRVVGSFDPTYVSIYPVSDALILGRPTFPRWLKSKLWISQFMTYLRFPPDHLHSAKGKSPTFLIEGIVPGRPLNSGLSMYSNNSITMPPTAVAREIFLTCKPGSLTRLQLPTY